MKPVTGTQSLSAIALALLTALPATAQQHAQHAHHPHGSRPHSHHAGLQHRAIKALSDQQVADLRTGKGMSMALAAELNGYPGPLHTLELADALQLSAEQRSRTQALFDAMQQQARADGEAVIAAEAAIDLLFREQRVTEDSLTAAVAATARAQGALRATHLRYHLRMMAVLTAEQVASYARLRGY